MLSQELFTSPSPVHSRPMNIPPNLQPILFIAGIALVSWVLLKRNGRQVELNRRDSRKFDTKPAPNSITNAGPLTGLSMGNAPTEISRWTIDLYDQMRDWQGELQTKSAVLQSLLQMAREETERLERRIEELRETSRPQPTSLSDKSETASENATTGKLETEARHVSEPEATAPFIEPALLQRCHRMAELGLSTGEVAQRLGRSFADTEFMLSLKLLKSS